MGGGTLISEEHARVVHTFRQQHLELIYSND